MVEVSKDTKDVKQPEVQQAPVSSPEDNFDQIGAEAKNDEHDEGIARQSDTKEADRIRVNLQRPPRISNLKKFLTEYWGLKDGKEVERVQFTEAINLPPQHQKGYDFLNDRRLAGTMIAIVPDDMWVKGDQPSESSAENDLILFKESYFNGSDDIGWMVHELAHNLRFKDKEEAYEPDSRTQAFDDIKSEYPYPNNRVEAYTFLQQFRYLREKGVGREAIRKMLRQDYEEADFRFFDRILD